MHKLEILFSCGVRFYGRRLNTFNWWSENTPLRTVLKRQAFVCGHVIIRMLDIGRVHDVTLILICTTLYLCCPFVHLTRRNKSETKYQFYPTLLVVLNANSCTIYDSRQSQKQRELSCQRTKKERPKYGTLWSFAPHNPWTILKHLNSLNINNDWTVLYLYCAY